MATVQLTLLPTVVRFSDLGGGGTAADWMGLIVCISDMIRIRLASEQTTTHTHDPPNPSFAEVGLLRTTMYNHHRSFGCGDMW